MGVSGSVLGLGSGDCVGSGVTEALGAGDAEGEGCCFVCAFEGDLFMTGVADGLGVGDGDFEDSGVLLSFGVTVGGALELGDKRL